MSVTSRTSIATEPDRPSVHISSRSGLADSALGTRNLMMIAALAVASMILLAPLNYLAPAAGASQGAVPLGCAIMGLWLMPYLLPATIIHRPGTAVIVAPLMEITSVFTTPTGLAAIVDSLIGGAFVEVSLVILLCRKWTWRSLLISTATFGLLSGITCVSIISAIAGIAPANTGIVITVVSALVGGGFTIVLTQLLNHAGVSIDHRTANCA